MKTLKTISILFIALLTFNCSNDDDNFEPQPEPQPTTHELLMSGKWYWEATSDGPLDDCQKQSSIEFIDEDTVLVENISTNAGDECESAGVNSYAYELVDDENIQIEVGGSTSNMHIEFISETQLIISQQFGSDTLTTTLRK